MPKSVWFKIWDITSLPTENKIVPSVLGTQNDIMKQGRVILSHGGFILPNSLIILKVLPLHFQLDYGVLPKLHLSLVQYMNRLRGKLPFKFHL